MIMVFLVPLFSGLGIWQLDRAEQKRNLSASQETRRKMPALSLNNGVPEADDLAFRQVSAEGEYLVDKTVLIENRKHLGKTGFHVITPLRLNGSDQVVLVNRGWIPLSQYDGIESLALQNNNVEVRGTIHRPQAPAIELGKPDKGVKAIPQWPYLTLENYSAWSGLQVLPITILQSPDDPHGFVRRWPQSSISDGMHIGYAIQWFAFALITLIIWWRLSLSRPKDKEVQA
ncbi:MAG: SURF1 family protein [Candidatus Thiodiazotropha sp. (ex Monitilora ramsayi)]|nr:SURF1 family protein [Candidatus Thiodiazotropha sp. (ex Monitilora ramsayi)]